jgi:hypothetical protein
MVISVRLRAPCEDGTGLRPPEFPAQEATIPFAWSKRFPAPASVSRLSDELLKPFSQ